MEGGLLAIACEKIEKLDVPAFIKDSELRFVAVNSAFEAFSGYDQSALVGREIGALTGRPEDRAWEDMERRVLVFAEEQLALCFDETGRDHCRAQIERFVTEDEKLFVFGVFRERPKSLKAKASRSSRDHGKPELSAGNNTVLPMTNKLTDFNELLDALPLGVLLLGPDLRIVHFNSTIGDMFASFGPILRPGGDFGALIDAVHTQDRRRGSKHGTLDWQRLVGLTKTDDAPAQQMALGEAVFDVCGKHLADGNVLIQFKDVTDLTAFEHESMLYRSVLENVPEAIFLRDGDRRLIFANATYEQMMGGDRSRFYGMREDEMFPRSARALRAENLSVLDEGVEIEREQLITMPNGVDVPLLTSLKRIEDAYGARYIVGTLTDISIVEASERQLVEARAQAEDLYQKLEGVLRTMPIGVAILDEDLVISFANDKLKEIVKWSDGKPINGVSFAEYVRHIVENGWPLAPGPDLETRIANRSAEMRSMKGTQQFERMVADGRYVLVSMTLLEQGQILITYSDYTEQRLREREITEAKAKLEDVGKLLNEAAHVMMQGMGVVQQDKILYANEKLAQVLDVPAHMIAEGANWRDLYVYCSERGDGGAREDANRFLEHMKTSLSEEKNVRGMYQRRDGVWISLEVFVSGGGRWLFVVHDISEAKNREAELRSLALQAKAADKAKSRFLASMGHEIRTPMSGVLGMAELLVSSDLDVRQKTFVDVILKSGRSLLTIINDILDFAKIDDQVLSLRNAPFDPLAAVEDVVLLMAGPAAEKDIELLVRGGGDLKHLVSGDAGRFRQILTKLVDVAIKATDVGHVLVDLAEHKESEEQLWLTVRVEDTGRGFTPEQRLTAFSRFSQFEEPAVYNKAGAGLSLSIVGGLVDVFGGTVALESDVGQGSVITVRLPLAIAGEKILQQPAFVLRGARVLALASNPLACGILNEQLRHWGFDGLALSEGQIIFDILREAIVADQPIEVLLIDFHKAGDEAMNLVRRVQESDMFNHLAIIALVPPSLSALQLELEEMQVQVQLLKPVADTLLHNAISDVLRSERRAARPDPSRSGPYLPALKPSVPAVEKAPLDIEAQAPSHTVAKSSLALAPNPNILIVSANEAECDFFRQVLCSEGIGYDIFASEEQAFTMWQQRKPRVMLIDLAYDDNDDFDFVRFIRAEESRSPDVVPTVLIGLSGSLSDHDDSVYLNAGLDGVLVKPVSAARLMACLRQWSVDSPSKQQFAL